MVAAAAPDYPAYRDPGDRPREYLLDAAAAAIATPRPGAAPPTWPLIEAPGLVEDVCADYLVAVDQQRASEADLAAEREQHRDTTSLLEAAQRESLRLQAMLTQRDGEIADLRRRLAAESDEVTLVVMAARRPARHDDGDPLRPPRRRVRWDALVDDEIDTRVIDVPFIGVAR